MEQDKLEAEARGHTPEAEAMTELILSIFRIHGRLFLAGDRLTRGTGLTSSRWQVLGAIANGPRTVAQIARHFESTRQGALFLVNALLKEGFVELIDNPEHKRAKLVRFTESGRAAFDEVSRRQEKWVNAFADHFDVDEVQRATNLLDRVARELTS